MGKFPIIRHVDDIEEAIKGCDEIAVMERGDFLIANYHYQTPDTFMGPHAALRRECRGLIFCAHTGRILSRRYHKFFNIGEKLETQTEVLPWATGYEVFTKFDGSMVSPAMTPQGVRWTTRMGITDVAMAAEAFIHGQAIREGMRLTEAAQVAHAHDITPIFEYVAPTNRIVVNYSFESMILCAIRHNITGEYMPTKLRQEFAKDYGLVTTEDLGLTGDDVERRLPQMEGEEGFVLVFGDQTFVKTKCPWYTAIHGAKDEINKPRLIVRHILHETLDDLKALVTAEDRKEIEQFESLFWNSFNYVCDKVSMEALAITNTFERKDYAQYAKHPAHLKPLVFGFYDGVPVKDTLMKRLKKLCDSTDKNFDEQARLLIGIGAT